MRRGLVSFLFLVALAPVLGGCHVRYRYSTMYAGNVPLVIGNQMPFPVWRMHISPSTSGSWGEDWLGAATIAPGQSFQFGVQPGVYDLRAVAQNGMVMAEARGVDLRGPQTLVVTPAGFQAAGGYAPQPAYGNQYPQTQGGYAAPPPQQGAVVVNAAPSTPPPQQGAVVVNAAPSTPPPATYSLTLHNSCPQTVGLFHGNGRPPFGSGTYGSIGSNTTESFSGTQGEQFWITDANRNGVSAFTPSGSQNMEILDSCNGFAPR